MLELLRTCRLIYAEGVYLLYSVPCFLMECIDMMMILKERVPPSRLNYLRALDLRYGLKTGIRCPDNFNFFLVEESKWQVHWEVVAEMKALERLRAQLSIINHTDDPHHILSAEDDREILAPLESVTEPEDFVVIVNWTVKADENGHGADHERKRSFRLLTAVG